MEFGILMVCMVINIFCYHGGVIAFSTATIGPNWASRSQPKHQWHPRGKNNLFLAKLSENSAGSAVVNGSNDSEIRHSEETTLIDPKDLLPVAPALSFRKFLTMQERRVVVTIRYAEHAGWKPYYLTAAKKIKASHPDVLLEKRVLPIVEGEEIFEIAVDGKVVISNQAKESTTRKVFCNMVELDLAISRARRRHRPSTAYGIVASKDDEAKEAD